MTNGYEDGISGVHLKNKKQQDRTMKQFMAGDIGPGEMGCGIELMVRVVIIIIITIIVIVIIIITITLIVINLSSPLTIPFISGRKPTSGQRKGGHVSGEENIKPEKKHPHVQAQGFDEYISEHLVSLNRSLPDRRDDWCKENVLVDPAYLPSTSV